MKVEQRTLISWILIYIFSFIVMIIKVDYLLYLSTAVVFLGLFKIIQNDIKLRNSNYKQSSLYNIQISDKIYTYAILILMYMFSMGIFSLLIGVFRVLV